MPDSKQPAQAIRSHRYIENRLHWCLDVIFGEDARRVRKDHAPENLNIVRKIAMNLLSSVQKMLPMKRLRACLDPAYLAQVLGVEVCVQRSFVGNAHAMSLRIWGTIALDERESGSRQIT